MRGISRRGRLVRMGVVGCVAAILVDLAPWPPLREPALAGRPVAAPLLLSSPDWYVARDLARGRSAEANLAWVAGGRVPGRGTADESMVRSSLLDLRRLVADDGGVSAGVSGAWAYDWPRDTAFVALALDRTGHRAEALGAFAFLARQRVRPDGLLEARYHLDGRGAPDGRPAQSDGNGWVLWSLGEMAAPVERPTRPGRPDLPVAGLELPSSVRALADRALDNLLRITASGRDLPPATPDYWEVRQSEPSLGQVAPILAGLRGAGVLYRQLGDVERARRAETAARRFAGVVEGAFAPTYQRFGDAGGRDAAVSMYLPPFAPEQPAVVAAWTDYQAGALRPAGGLAPGTSWLRYQESWTPETALVAYTAASSGRPEIARRWLDWLDSVRTPWGALPEKVLADGSSAGPAPLAWTAALVVLTVDALERRPS